MFEVGLMPPTVGEIYDEADEEEGIGVTHEWTVDGVGEKVGGKDN